MHDSANPHSTAWSQIPWLVNGTIDEQDRAELERHLRGCPACREQYVLECRIRDAMTADSSPANEQLDKQLADLFASMDAGQDAEPADSAPIDRQPAQHNWIRTLAAAVVVQAIGLAALGAILLQQTDAASAVAAGSQAANEAAYRTLSLAKPAAPAAVIRFVPAPDMPIASLHRLLEQLNLRLVESNPGSSIFGLALLPPPAESAAVGETEARRIQRAVEQLSQRQDVLLAEPIQRPRQAGKR